MRRVLVYAVAVVVAASAPTRASLLSPEDRETYRKAFDAVKADAWDEALETAREADDPLPRRVIRWLWYRAPGSDATFREVTDFIRKHPDWPLSWRLQERAEQALEVDTPDDLVLAFYESGDREPRTSNGAIALAEALKAAERREAAARVARRAWLELSFGRNQQKRFLDRFSDAVDRADHRKRLNRLLWDGLSEAPRRMFPFVRDGWEKLARARIMLRHDVPGVDPAVAAVPDDLVDHPGLVYERVAWRRRHGMEERAIDLLLQHPGDPGREDIWWPQRQLLARYALAHDAPRRAYRVASQHGQTDGVELAKAEWLSGWIALRFRNAPETAFGHFRKLYDNVSYPISLTRGAYWAGRAREAQGAREAAKKWYRRAARHTTTYYGQLAASRLDERGDWPLPADPLPTAQDMQAFNAWTMTRVVRQLGALDRTGYIAPFILEMHDRAETPGQHALVTALSRRYGRHDLSVRGAKEALEEGIRLIASAYPVPDLPRVSGIHRPLLLAVAQQESAFKTNAISPAGARGLMQLMPATASRMARHAEMRFSRRKLIADARYNLRLGARYLEILLERYEGSVVLALAAYNAGMSRVEDWMDRFGDPRDPEVNVIDWVEWIPFSETRNYVQRVLEATQVYSRQLGNTEVARSLPAALNISR